MNQDYIPEKSSHSLGLLSSNRYAMDLSNEILTIDFDQWVAKISEVKLGERKKYLPTRPTPGARVRGGLIGRYFF